MSAADEAAVLAFPTLGGLIAIRESGWTFLFPRMLNGVPVRVDGYRNWPGGWLDAIRVHSDTDAMGLRSDGREPPGIVFERIGSLTHVVEGLLTLPTPDTRLAPRLVRATAPKLWVP